MMNCISDVRSLAPTKEFAETEQLSKENNVCVTQPFYIKEELNISNVDTSDRYDDDWTININNNLTSKLLRKQIFIKSEIIDEEVVTSELSDCADDERTPDNNFNLMRDHFFIKLEKCRNNLSDEDYKQLTSSDYFANKHLVTEVKKCSNESEREDSILNKTSFTSSYFSDTLECDSTNMSQELNITGDDSTSDEDFVLRMSDDSDEVPEYSEINDQENVDNASDIGAENAKNQAENTGSNLVPVTREKSKRNSALKQSTITNYCTVSKNSSNEVPKSPPKLKNVDNRNNLKIVTNSGKKVIKRRKKAKFKNLMAQVCTNCNIMNEDTAGDTECSNCGTDQKKFKCLMCNVKICDTKSGLYKHIQNRHLSNSNNSCKSTYDKNEIKKFVILSCLGCNNACKMLNGKIIACQECNVNMVLRCLICSKYCDTIKGIYSHILQKHREQFVNVVEEMKQVDSKSSTPNIPVAIPIKTAVDSQPAVIPIKSHSTNRRVCPKCGIRFKHRRSLQSHMQFCGREPDIQCEFCSHKTKYKYNLKIHVAQKHPERNISKNNEANVNTKSHNTYENSSNDKPKEILPDLDATEPEHKLDSTNINLGAENNNVKSHSIKCKICPKCNKEFYAPNYLMKHMKFCGKEPNLQCEFCPHKTKYPNNLKLHIAQMHSAQRRNKISKPVATKINVGDAISKAKQNLLDSDDNIRLDKNKSKLTDNENMSNTMNKEKKAKSTEAITSVAGDVPFSITPNKLSPLNMCRPHCPKCDDTLIDAPLYSQRKCQKCKTRLLLKCLKCERKYETHQGMLYHLQSKCDPQTYFRCSMCDYTTTVSNLIRRHVTRTHGLKYQSAKGPRPATEHNGSLYGKQSPDNVSGKLESIRQVRGVHQTRRRSVGSSRKPRRCPQCFKMLKKLPEHLKFCGKEANICCEFCPYKTRFPHCLKAHMQTHLSKSNPPASEIVNDDARDNKVQPILDNKNTSKSMNNTTNPSAASDHQKYLPTKSLLPLYCSRCKKPRPEGGIIARRRSAASDLRCIKCATRLTYRCTECSVTCANLNALQLHTISHGHHASDQKVLLELETETHRCISCGKGFALPQNLSMHEKVCAAKTTQVEKDKLRFQCEFCPYASKWRITFIRHVMLRHPVKK